MTAIRYTGPFDLVEVPALGLVVAHGDTVEVPAEVAGTAPTGDDPGSGLLAQTANWQPAAAPNRRRSAGADQED